MHNDTKVHWALCDECGDEYDMASREFRLFNDGICRCLTCQDNFEDCPYCHSTYRITEHCECEYCATCSDVIDDDGVDDLCGNCADRILCDDCGQPKQPNDDGEYAPGRCTQCQDIVACASLAVRHTGTVQLRLILGGKGRKRDS